MKPLVIDMFSGLHGWAEGFLAEGYRVLAFDLYDMRRQCGLAPLVDGNFQLVLQDVLTLDGAQFRDAAVIVASPPCEEFSRWQMPWTLARNPPEPSLDLVNACWRIAAEAGVPLVLENVRAAQRWLGSARAHWGSRYLWGDVPPLMPAPGVDRMKESYASTAKAQRAKIPLPLARHIARCFKPVEERCA